MKRGKLLYFYFTRTSFVAKDERIFSSAYHIQAFHRATTGRYDILSYLLLQFFFLLRHAWTAKVMVCQFAGHHSLLPVLFGKMLGKPVLLIPGGTDCVAFPSISYGQFNKKWLARTTCWSYRHAAHIAPVHESLVLSKYTYTSDDYPEQGFRAFCKNVRTPVTVIYNGYESDKFRDLDLERKPNSFLSIAAGLDSEVRIKLKGIDLVLQAAASLPECSFTVIGSNRPPNLEVPPNVTIIPPMDNAKLPEVMNRHEFYLQLSLSEGFPNALSEAMLCGCIPVVSDVASMPGIIHDSGFVLKKRDPELLAELLREAQRADKNELRMRARKRIAEHYPLQKREMQLLSLLESLTKK